MEGLVLIDFSRQKNSNRVRANDPRKGFSIVIVLSMNESSAHQLSLVTRHYTIKIIVEGKDLLEGHNIDIGGQCTKFDVSFCVRAKY